MTSAWQPPSFHCDEETRHRLEEWRQHEAWRSSARRDDPNATDGDASDDSKSDEIAPLLIVLDMDDTLISRQGGEYDILGKGRQVDAKLVFNITLSDGTKRHIIKRPGLDEFVQELSRGMAAGEYQVAIFTAAPQFYADAVLDRIDLAHRDCIHHKHRFAPDGVTLLQPMATKSVFHIRRYKQHLTILSKESGAKDISFFNRPMSRTILVDDHPTDAAKLHPDNVIPATEFIFRYDSNFRIAETDDFLPKLSAYLQTLVRERDVRVPLREKFQISASESREFSIFL
jgi:TFIIF-interacting CTD phosphatase-like protein